MVTRRQARAVVSIKFAVGADANRRAAPTDHLWKRLHFEETLKLKRARRAIVNDHVWTAGFALFNIRAMYRARTSPCTRT